MPRPMEQALHTAKDLVALGDDFELDEGVLVPVSPNNLAHGVLCLHLGGLLSALPGLRARYWLLAEAGFVLERDPDTVRGPDLSLLSRERFPHLPARGFGAGAPDLAVEILSPDDRPGAVQRKVGQYLGAGCRAVLIVDLSRRHVVAYEADGSIRIARPGESVPVLDLGAEVSVAEIFRELEG